MATTKGVQQRQLTENQKVSPNQSLYIQNLPLNVQREDIRRGLYILFSTYGSVLDVNVMRNARMRGQAHVLFKDIQTATQAMRACSEFEFLGRRMRISYSKNRSDTLSKLTGTFRAPESEEAKPTIPQASALPPPPGTGPTSTLPAPPSGLPPPPGMPPVNGLKAPAAPADNALSPQGIKRGREDSDDEGAPMEDSDDDDEGAMEMSDDEDD